MLQYHNSINELSDDRVLPTVPLLMACMVQHTCFGAIKFILGSMVNL